MFKQKFYRIVSILCILLLSCTKFGKNIYVDGYIYDQLTGAGIPNIEVVLIRNKTGTLGTTSGGKIKFSVFTDSDGYYKIENLAGVMKQYIRVDLTFNQNNTLHRLGWKIDGELNHGTNLLALKKGKKIRADYEFLYFGYLKTVIRNENCISNLDTLILSRIHTVYSDYNLINRAIYKGCYFNETKGSVDNSPDGFRSVLPGIYKYDYEVIKNGVKGNFSFTNEVVAGKYDTVQILY